MPNSDLPGEGWIHLIGIGGAGMSGLAFILLQMGRPVSGSDLSESPVTHRLAQKGAVVHRGHDARNLDPRVSLVAISTAVAADNPEVVEARKRGIQVIHRGELLARIFNSRKGIGVSGAHGKTTTTSMIALTMERNGLDPTILIGGELKELSGNAKLGRNEYIVSEADESDGSFLRLYPHCTVVTNVENDHLDYYQNFENIEKAFRQFLVNTRPDGFAVLCWDDATLCQLSGQIDRRVVTYGLSPEADFWIDDIKLAGLSSSARVNHRDKTLGVLELSVPGRHNLINALAAVAVGHEIGIPFPGVAEALKPFRGVHRRFEVLGEVNGVTVVDDYAHHPTEIKATLQAARHIEGKRIIAVFQPHRFTRTHFLHEEFGGAFGDADQVIIDGIYSAGEKPIPGVSAELIVDAVKRRGQEVVYLPDRDKILELLTREVRPDDLVITLGAGNIWTVGEALVKALKSSNELDSTTGE